jgi:hypothetical protein
MATTQKIDPKVSGRRGGLILAAKMTPEQRKERSRRAYLAGAVRTIAANLDQLTDDQRQQLHAALCP